MVARELQQTQALGEALDGCDDGKAEDGEGHDDLEQGEAGDVLLADRAADTIKRLVVAIAGGPLPGTLADTGAFADPASLTPAQGLVPYDVNVPFWSDNAQKTRWFYIPTNQVILFQSTNQVTRHGFCQSARPDKHVNTPGSLRKKHGCLPR